MNSEGVAQIVRKEINDDWDHSNHHGVDLRKCLVQPQKMRFYLDMSSDKQEEYWLVLEEIPEDGSGYKIVFDENTGMFGLATSDVKTDKNYFIGLYGNFLETVDAM